MATAPTTDRALTHRHQGVVATVALLVCFLQRPGRISPDTKLDLTADPLGFLTRAAHLWSPDAPMGQVQNQAYGYFFPHGAFFVVGDLLHLPPWITQRLWWALLLTIGFIGVVRLAETLRIGSFGSRLIAGWVFVLAPRVMTTLGTISSETLPMMLAPWVLIPLIRALDPVGETRRPGWQEAARSACAVALMGAVNAVATGAAVAVAALWWLATLAGGRHRRRTLAVGGWWSLTLVAVCVWWLVPLLILARISPPFLDFIESSAVTTEWTSLTEVLRGTSAWTPFVSSERAVGAVLVSEPAAVLATGVLAAAGLAGLAMRAMPHRRTLLLTLTVGLLAMCLGYPGGLGSPIRDTVVGFLDGSGAALRNVHKFDPLIRLPLALGVAHLLARVRLPERRAAGRPHHGSRVGEKGFAAALVVVIAAFGSGSLLWTGGLAPSQSYRAVEDYWQQTADWLRAAQHDAVTPARALVAPGAPFADQLWGLTRDEPLQPLARTPWTVRDAIPLVPSGAIRAMDSVQRALASGRGSPGLAATLAEQGVGYVVLRADLDPESRSARPLAVAQALAASPGLSVAARFGPMIAPPTVDDVVIDDGLRPRMPAITVYRVDATGGTATDSTAGGPRLVDVDGMARVSGGPESLLSIQDARRRAGLPPMGPAILAADAARAGLPPAPLVVTDSPVDREVDFGRVDDHASAVRAAGDPRLTKNRVPDYPVDDQAPVRAQWLLDNEPGRVRVTTSGSAADATQPGRTVPAAAAAAAFDEDPDTAWVSRGLESAVGRWIALEFSSPRSGLAVSVTTAKALGPDVTSVLVSTDTGSTVAHGLEAGVPTRVLLPPGPTEHIQIRAIQTADSSGGNQFAVADLSLVDAATDTPLKIRQRTVLPTLDAADRVRGWQLHAELGHRSDCLTQTDGRVRCSPALGLRSETPGVFGRTLSVPSETTVEPTVVLRPVAGGDLSALLRREGTITAEGPSAVTDPRGTAAAAVDGDPNTAWIAPTPAASESRTPSPRLTLRLPAPREVSGLRIHTFRDYPARPTRVSVELRRDGRSIGLTGVRVADDGTVQLPPRRADTVVVTVDERSDLLNINALGFAEDAPVGISEITVLPDAGPPAGVAVDDDRVVEFGCDTDSSSPYALGVSASGTVLRLHATTTVGALRRGEPLVATGCDDGRLTLAAGEQEISVNPGRALTVDAVSLPTVGTAPAPVRQTRPRVTEWGSTDRTVEVDAADADRVLTVPESTNPGWRARLHGRELAPVVVNGWQQGWLVPAGSAGTVALTVDLDAPYRWAIGLGLALVAAVFAVAFLPRRRLVVDDEPAPPAAPGPRSWLARGAVVAALLVPAVLLTGWWGAGIAVAAGTLTLLLPPRRRPILVFTAMTGATAVLAAGPWHSSLPYLGYSLWPQALATVAVAAAIAAAASSRRIDP